MGSHWNFWWKLFYYLEVWHCKMRSWSRLVRGGVLLNGHASDLAEEWVCAYQGLVFLFFTSIFLHNHQGQCFGFWICVVSFLIRVLLWGSTSRVWTWGRPWLYVVCIIELVYITMFPSRKGFHITICICTDMFGVQMMMWQGLPWGEKGHLFWDSYQWQRRWGNRKLVRFS